MRRCPPASVELVLSATEARLSQFSPGFSVSVSAIFPTLAVALVLDASGSGPAYVKGKPRRYSLPAFSLRVSQVTPSQDLAVTVITRLKHRGS